jgi:hypothetical protein
MRGVAEVMDLKAGVPRQSTFDNIRKFAHNNKPQGDSDFF